MAVAAVLYSVYILLSVTLIGVYKMVVAVVLYSVHILLSVTLRGL